MVKLSDEDVVVVTLGRRLRQASAAEYERFLRLAAKALLAVELQQGREGVIDLTHRSDDNLRLV